jgi:hypothetical protein
MRYNTLKISVDEMRTDLGYVDAIARVRTGGREFKKQVEGLLRTILPALFLTK